MSKRKREIKKRKKLQEEMKEDENLLQPETIEPARQPEWEPPGDTDREDLSNAEPPIDDSQIVSAPVASTRREKKAPAREPRAAADSWFGRNKENLLLGLLILYVLLLGLGTVGELFEIGWILNLPLFR